MLAQRETKQQLAAKCGVTRKCLHAWERQGCPTDQGVEAILRWRDDNKRAQHGGSSMRTQDKSGSLRERLLRAQCERTEQQARAEQLANDEKAALLVDREEIGHEVACAGALLRTRIEELPDYVANGFNGDDRHKVAAMVDGRIYLFLRETAAGFRKAVGTNLDDLILETAARIQRKREDATNHPARSTDATDGDSGDGGGFTDGGDREVESRESNS